MIESQGPAITSLKIALGAIFAALVFVATYSFVVPIPATKGYFNLGEIVIYVAALMFGPFVGAVAGVGASMADIIVPTAAQFAPGTFLIKGLEGATVGFLCAYLQKYMKERSFGAILSIVAGGLIMVSGYFLYEQLVLGYPFFLALVEVPFNIVQLLVGLVVSIPIVNIILRVFPQLDRSHSDFR
jgi:uncharacterized membrane protein